jgi:succinoglycan biosynthesis protein ExoM
MQPRRVLIAVLTYRRPDDLDAALESLVAHLSRASTDADILVVDNSPEGGAKQQVALAEARARRAIRYAHEPQPGIAAARNRALLEANADLLVFIDDDERPQAGWLDALVGAHARWDPTGVVGPVVSEYAAPPDAWIRAGGFFVRRRPPTGSRLDVAATNNLLLDLGALARLGGIRFDERFGLSGGSDTLFTREIVRRGGSLVWCAEAVVVDVVPESRLTREWVLRRARRSGNSWSRVALALEPSRRRRAFVRVALLARGAFRVVAGAAGVAVGRLGRRIDVDAKGRKAIARGTGMLSGAVGHVVVEYRR